MMVAMVVEHQTHAVKGAFLWRFLTYELQLESQVDAWVAEYLSNRTQIMKVNSLIHFPFNILWRMKYLVLLQWEFHL